MAFIELTRYFATIERRFLINTDCITHVDDVDVYAHGVGASVGSYVYVTMSEGVIAVRESYDQVVRLLTGNYSTVKVDSKIFENPVNPVLESWAVDTDRWIYDESSSSL